MNQAKLVIGHVNDLISRLEVKVARRSPHTTEPSMLAFQAAGAVNAFHHVGLLSDTQRAESMERISSAMRDPGQELGSRTRPDADRALSPPVANTILSVIAGPWQLISDGVTILSVEKYGDAVIVHWLLNAADRGSVNDDSQRFQLADDSDRSFVLRRARTGGDGSVIRGEYLFTPAVQLDATELVFHGTTGETLRIAAQ